MSGCDAVIHLAGIVPRRHPGIRAAGDVRGERRAHGTRPRRRDLARHPAHRHRVDVNVFGNTRGRIVDEKYRRDPADGFLSYYDETKYRAHVAAKARISAGAPIVIVMPGTVYGAERSLGGRRQLAATCTTARARYIALGDAGVSPTYVDDLAGGVVAAMDRGRPGESYVLAGENMRLRDAIRIVAQAAGRRPPRLSACPTGLLRLGARIAPGGGRLVGPASQPRRDRQRGSLGVTYWASSAKAQADLGYRTRDLERGARDAYGRP